MILAEHGAIGMSFGAGDYAHDIRLACHGLDKDDNDFIIGLIGKELFPLSALVQTMRKTQQTSLYLERLGPFFVGRALWQSPTASQPVEAHRCRLPDDADEELDDGRQTEADIDLRPFEHQHVASSVWSARNGSATSRDGRGALAFTSLHSARHAAPALCDVPKRNVSIACRTLACRPRWPRTSAACRCFVACSYA